MSDKLMWKNIDLNLLVAFSYLYKYQSVTVAADHYCISQSAMSHSLSRLRILLGDPLFERKQNLMLPTEYAKQIAPTIESLLQQIQTNLLVKTPFVAEEYQGVCRIGLTDYAEFLFAPLIYDAVREFAPLAQISFIKVDRSNCMEVFESGKLDLLIGSIPSADQRLSCKYLYTEKHVCIASRSLLKGKETLSAEEFSQLEHALVSPDGKLSTLVDKSLSEHGLKRRVTVSSSNFLTVKRLVELSKLIAIVPEKVAGIPVVGNPVAGIPVAGISAADDTLVKMTPPVPVADFDISMLWLSRQTKNEKNSWLRALLCQALSEHCI